MGDHSCGCSSSNIASRLTVLSVVVPFWTGGVIQPWWRLLALWSTVLAKSSREATCVAYLRCPWYTSINGSSTGSTNVKMTRLRLWLGLEHWGDESAFDAGTESISWSRFRESGIESINSKMFRFQFAYRSKVCSDRVAQHRHWREHLNSSSEDGLRSAGLREPAPSVQWEHRLGVPGRHTSSMYYFLRSKHLIVGDTRFRTSLQILLIHNVELIPGTLDSILVAR